MSYPLPLGWDAGETTSSFAGKVISGKDGGKGLINNVIDLKKLQVAIIEPLAQGETFSIIDVQQGDHVQWM